MKKNTSGQVIGAQMCSATDGSAFTGTVTVYVTGDAGTQAIGSVGSGVCTHEGNGYHTYAPSQAETNYDLVAFTFIGTGAIPSTVQVATVPAAGLASPTNITAATGIVLAAATHTGAIIPRVTLVDTTTTNTDMRGTDNAATAANLAIVAGYLDTEITTILADLGTVKAITDQFVFTVANQVDANALSGGGGSDAQTIIDGVLAAFVGVPVNIVSTFNSATGTLSLQQGVDYADDSVSQPIDIPLADKAQFEVGDEVTLLLKITGQTSEEVTGEIVDVGGALFARFTDYSPTTYGTGLYEVWHVDDSTNRTKAAGVDRLVIEREITPPA